MSTLEIARAYLVPIETIKKRISRAKTLIKETNIPFEIPSKAELNRRIGAVLCSGLINPDTNIGGKITTIDEVIHGKKETYIFNRI